MLTAGFLRDVIRLFAARDMMTIFTSFSVPSHVAAELKNRKLVDDRNAHTVAQLACPMAVQLVSTPLHLLGLDLYNRPKQTVGSR